MTEARNNFGRIASLSADAVGEPGQRRFRLQVEATTGRTATLWLEKEQLFDLAVELKRLIASAEETEGSTGRHGEEVAGEEDPEPDPGLYLDFRVSRLALGYDQRRRLYVITAQDAESPEDAQLPDISLLADRAQLDALADTAFRVCAAGRPLCPLCSAPLGEEPHVCPKQNGHVGALE